MNISWDHVESIYYICMLPNISARCYPVSCCETSLSAGAGWHEGWGCFGWPPVFRIWSAALLFGQSKTVHNHTTLLQAALIQDSSSKNPIASEGIEAMNRRRQFGYRQFSRTDFILPKLSIVLLGVLIWLATQSFLQTSSWIFQVQDLLL